MIHCRGLLFLHRLVPYPTSSEIHPRHCSVSLLRLRPPLPHFCMFDDAPGRNVKRRIAPTTPAAGSFMRIIVCTLPGLTFGVAVWCSRATLDCRSRDSSVCPSTKSCCQRGHLLDGGPLVAVERQTAGI
jgi:hypothetical protein